MDLDFLRTPGSNLEPADKLVFDEIKSAVEVATSDFLIRPDSDANARCVDLVAPLENHEILVEVALVLRKKLRSSSPKVILLALRLFEALVRSGASSWLAVMDDERVTREIAAVARSFCKRSGSENAEVRDTALEVVQQWGEMFLTHAHAQAQAQQSERDGEREGERERVRVAQKLIDLYLDLRREGLPFRESSTHTPTHSHSLSPTHTYHHTQVPMTTSTSSSASASRSVDTYRESIAEREISLALQASLDLDDHSYTHTQAQTQTHSRPQSARTQPPLNPHTGPQTQQIHTQSADAAERERRAQAMARQQRPPSGRHTQTLTQTHTLPPPAPRVSHTQSPSMPPRPPQNTRSPRPLVPPLSLPVTGAGPVSAFAPPAPLQSPSQHRPSPVPMPMPMSAPVPVNLTSSPQSVLSQLQHTTSLLAELLMGTQSTEELRANERASIFAEQLASLQRSVNVAIERAMDSPELLERLFAANDASLAVMRAHNELAQGCVSVEDTYHSVAQAVANAPPAVPPFPQAHTHSHNNAHHFTHAHTTLPVAQRAPSPSPLISRPPLSPSPHTPHTSHTHTPSTSRTGSRTSSRNPSPFLLHQAPYSPHTPHNVHTQHTYLHNQALDLLDQNTPRSSISGMHSNMQSAQSSRSESPSLSAQQQHHLRLAAQHTQYNYPAHNAYTPPVSSRNSEGHAATHAVPTYMYPVYGAPVSMSAVSVSVSVSPTQTNSQSHSPPPPAQVQYHTQPQPHTQLYHAHTQPQYYTVHTAQPHMHFSHSAPPSPSVLPTTAFFPDNAPTHALTYAHVQAHTQSRGGVAQPMAPPHNPVHNVYNTQHAPHTAESAPPPKQYNKLLAKSESLSNEEIITTGEDPFAPEALDALFARPDRDTPRERERRSRDVEEEKEDMRNAGLPVANASHTVVHTQPHNGGPQHAPVYYASPPPHTNLSYAQPVPIAQTHSGARTGSNAQVQYIYAPPPPPLSPGGFVFPLSPMNTNTQQTNHAQQFYSVPPPSPSNPIQSNSNVNNNSNNRGGNGKKFDFL